MVVYVCTQSLSHVWLFVIPWIALHQACLFSTVRKFAQIHVIELVMLSDHLILYCPLLLLLWVLPSIRVFSNGLALHIRGQSIGASASAPVLSMNIQGWFPLRLTALISLLSKGSSKVFSSTIQKHQFFGTQPSLLSNCHEIKRHLFFGREAMTNLVCEFKSRDITLPTKVCIVKAMAIPVVTYGCELDYYLYIYTSCLLKTFISSKN